MYIVPKLVFEPWDNGSYGAPAGIGYYYIGPKSDGSYITKLYNYGPMTSIECETLEAAEKICNHHWVTMLLKLGIIQGIDTSGNLHSECDSINVLDPIRNVPRWLDHILWK